MGFIFGFLGACLGIIAGIGIIIFIVYYRVRGVVGVQNIKSIVTAAKNAKSIEEQEYTREKNVGGITKLIEPVIVRDFSEFNKDFLYSKVEKNLTKIFNAIENKSLSEIKTDDDLIYMYPTLKEKIEDMKNNKVNIKYDDVSFNSHAIKDYIKMDGKATITISTTLGYVYSDDSTKSKFDNLKKQTRYTTKFVYVYDETKLKDNKNVIVISCPNCGAPLRGLGANICQYCGTYNEPVNLKGWFMISYDEDYK